MAKRQRPVLQGVQYDRPITEETSPEFLFLLQQSLLLALREQGTLDQIQYARAQERLERQRHDRAAKC